MLDKFFKRFKQDNDVKPQVETSPFVNAEGMEGQITVPEPTKDDRKWAKKIKDGASTAITSALKGAIAEGRNWRVWYLLNRPLKAAEKFLFVKTPEKGFGAPGAVETGLSEAAKHNNVTAAYLILKYVEKNQAALDGEDNDKKDFAQRMENTRAELAQVAGAALRDAAEAPGPDVYKLLAQTFSSLHDRQVHPATDHAIADYQTVMKESALRAAAEGQQGNLDAMLHNRLLTPQQFVEAYMASFFFDKTLGGDQDTAPEARKAMLDWLISRGIVDKVFADEAAMVETRMMDARRTADEAAAQGWKQSTRDLPLTDGGVAKADSSQVEITKHDAIHGAITYVFNLAANRAHRIKGPLAQELPEALVDPALAEQARQFLESTQTVAPSLEWKKGEPFRLRFKPKPLALD